VEVLWTDVCDAGAVEAALDGQDAVVHLAGIVPPEVDRDPRLAERVNVGGTRTVVNAALRQRVPPRLLLASTFDLFGHTQDQPPPRRIGDPVSATDEYTRHKLRCEGIVRESGLAWAIFRFCDVPPERPYGADPIMFSIPLANRIEVLHREDAALAIARAITAPVWGRAWLVGGGAACQVRYEEYLRAALDKAGVGMLPREAFATDPYCTDWLDSADTEALLAYQHHSFAQIMADLPAPRLAPTWAIRLARPLVHRHLLRLSPAWRARRQPVGTGSLGSVEDDPPNGRRS